MFVKIEFESTKNKSVTVCNCPIVDAIFKQRLLRWYKVNPEDNTQTIAELKSESVLVDGVHVSVLESPSIAEASKSAALALHDYYVSKEPAKKEAE